VEKLVRFAAFALMACLAASACKKKEEKQLPSAMPPGAMVGQQSEAVIVVPDSVQGKWKSVTLAVLDKTSGKATDYEVAIGSKVPIPGADLVVEVLYFMPDFAMFGNKRTSKSNEPKNPAAQVRVSEGGKEIYKNWLFSMLKTPHAFQHPKYDISLKGFTPAGK